MSNRFENYKARHQYAKTAINGCPIREMLDELHDVLACAIDESEPVMTDQWWGQITKRAQKVLDVLTDHDEGNLTTQLVLLVVLGSLQRQQAASYRGTVGT